MEIKMIHVVADVVAKSDKIDFVKEALVELAIKVNTEETGFTKYELFQDSVNPAIFKVIEIWNSKEELEKHAAYKNLVNFVEKTEGSLEVFEPYIMNKLS